MPAGQAGMEFSRASSREVDLEDLDQTCSFTGPKEFTKTFGFHFRRQGGLALLQAPNVPFGWLFSPVLRKVLSVRSYSGFIHVSRGKIVRAVFRAVGPDGEPDGSLNERSGGK